MQGSLAIPAAGIDQTRSDLVNLLAGLYEAQKEGRPYLADHSSNSAVLRRQVDVFLRYRPFIQPGRILDWGCRHAPDSCLLRATFGDEVRLSGCDVMHPKFPVFHERAGLNFARLSHPWQLPYDDANFDTVIGSGVLEHVPNDSESLKELHRVLRKDGRLILSFLPNALSISEFLARALHRSHHARLYSRRSIQRMLLHHGFRPQLVGFHQWMPTLAGARSQMSLLTRAVEIMYAANPVMERLWLVRAFASNLLVVAQKCVSM